MKTVRVGLAVVVLVVFGSTMAFPALHVVDIQGGINGSFSPSNIEIDEDDQIRWENVGSSVHNSRSLTGVWSSPNISVGGTYTRQFTSPGNFPYTCTLHDFDGNVSVVPASGILDDPGVGGQLPNLVALRQNSPNPFNAATQIEYSLNRDTEVQLAVYNILGQRIATLVEGFQTGGLHTAIWDGRDSNGNDTPSGIYFARMITTEVLMTRKMVLLR